MKKTGIFLSIIAIILAYCITNLDTISEKAIDMFDSTPKPVISAGNAYTKNKGYKFVNLSKDYTPYSYQDLLDIIYSVANNGWEQFTFYCPSEYTECLADIEKICKDSTLQTHINNFVHPFNTYTYQKFTRAESGEVNLTITYLYTKEEQEYISKEIKKIIDENVTSDMNNYDKIKSVHDYIINNTKYDIDKKKSSAKASELLKNHIATCNGYADAMAVALSQMGFDNYKIATTAEDISYSSTGHVWNAVYVDNEWRHLDLTWDDPVGSDGKDYLYHKYFLVNNEEMAEADKGDVVIEEHNFKKQIYLEFK